MNERILKNILWSVICLAAFIPLFLNTSVIYPFTVAKTSIFRFLVILAFGILLCLLFLKGRKSWLLEFGKNKIFQAWLLLLIAFGLSAIFGVDTYNSLWSGAERMMGIISWVSFFLFYIVLVYGMANNQSKRRIFQYLVLMGAGMVSLSAIVAYFSGFFLPAFKGQRLTGLSGNPSYLAVYMLFSSFLALSLAFEDYEKNKNSGFVFWLLGFLYFSLILFGTGTRGAMVGWGSGALGVLVYLVFHYKRKWLGKTALTVILLGISLLGLALSFKNTDFIKNNIGLSRLVSIVNFQSDTTAQSRLFSYKAALNAWPEKPIFGWGLENYKPAFLRHIIPEMYNNNPNDVSFDRAHNMPLEILATTGIVGFSAYLYFFYISFNSLWEKARLGEISKTVAIVLGAGLVGYFLSNLFLFDVFESLFMLTIFLALATPSNEFLERKLIHTSRQPTRSRSVISAVVIAIITGGALYIGVFLPYRTSYYIAQAKKAWTTGKIETAYQALSSAISTETLASRDGLADFLKPYIQRREALSENDKNRFDALIRDNLHLLAKRHPTFAGSADYLVYFLINRPDATSADILEAETLESRLVAYAPNYLDYRSNLAFIYGLAKDYDKATAEINYVLSKTDKLSQPYWYKGIILNMKGDKAEALDNFTLAIQKGYAASTEELNVLIQQAVIGKRYDYLVTFYNKGIEMDPKNLQNYASLAAAYQKLGDYNNARLTAQKMLALDPAVKPQVDAFLKTLPATQ